MKQKAEENLSISAWMWPGESISGMISMYNDLA